MSNRQTESFEDSEHDNNNNNNNNNTDADTDTNNSSLATNINASLSSSSSSSIVRGANLKRSINSGDSKGSKSNTASSSQRLSSIEILNENKQRQSQFKQQESFKLQMEQRQKKLIEQQKQHQISKDKDFNLADDEDLGVTYEVNTNMPDFMASGAQQKQNNSSKNTSSSLISANDSLVSGSKVQQASQSNANPFDREPTKGSLNRSKSQAEQQHKHSNRPTSAPIKGGGQKDEESSATTVSGKSGFLSALLDEASFDPADPSSEEFNQTGANKTTNKYLSEEYAQKLRYNYGGGKDEDNRPFYEKDLPTLLQECRASRKLVIAIVAIALLLDNMLLTSVVPIIPYDLLKNRIERKHADELIKQQQFSSSNATLLGQKFKSKSKTNRKPGSLSNETIDEELSLQEELARKIDKLLSEARSRYTGSVLHPQVFHHGEGNLIEQNDDNDDDGDGDGDDDDDDDGNDDNEELGTKSAETNRQRNSKFRQSSLNSNRAKNNDKASKKKKKQPMINDYDVDDDDGPAKNNAKQMMMSKSSSSLDAESDDDHHHRQHNERENGRKQGPTTSAANGANDADDDADGDDEDMASSKKWNNLKSSLMMMAKSTNGSDPDSLAGMCLNLVLGDTDQLEIKARPLKKRSPRVPKLATKPSKNKTQSPTTTTQAPAQPVKGSDVKLDQIGSVSQQEIVDLSFEVGIMFASKPIVQAIANPFIGTLTNKVGFTIPMFTGFVIMFISTLVFAFGSSFPTLFIARAIQGVGSACTSVAGMSMLADRFPDDAERGNAMAIALGGLALGVVIGPPFGGFMYEFISRSSPFIVLSFLALLDGLLQLLVLQPRVIKSQEEGASLMTLIKDPYILVAAGAITFANTGIAILEPALPLWMMRKMQATNWEQGVAFLPAALSYMFGTNLFGNLGHKIGRWRSTMIGLILIGCSLLLIPFATRVDHLIIPNGIIGFAMGMVDSTMMPMLGYLVDIRHTSVYGSVYAIGDVAFCASFAFGPFLSGTLVKLIGFEGLIITTAIICFSFAPLLLLLRNPPPREMPSESQLQEQSTLRYVNYNQLDYCLEEGTNLVK